MWWYVGVIIYVRIPYNVTCTRVELHTILKLVTRRRKNHSRLVELAHGIIGLLAGSVLDKNGDLVGLVERGVIPCLRKGSVG